LQLELREIDVGFEGIDEQNKFDGGEGEKEDCEQQGVQAVRKTTSAGVREGRPNVTLLLRLRP
jgi:hypothetical protein